MYYLKDIFHFSLASSIFVIFLLPLTALAEYRYVGCYTGTPANMLRDASMSLWRIQKFQTLEACANFCQSGNAPQGADSINKSKTVAPPYAYTYLENPWCFCGNQIQNATKVNDNLCQGQQPYLKNPRSQYTTPPDGGRMVFTIMDRGGGSTIGGNGGSNALGKVWRENESGWSGVWTRRGNSNTFDATWTKGAGRVTAVLTIQIRGNSVSISRNQGSDGNNCKYTGSLAADRRSVSGTYTCNRYSGPYSWSAQITSGGESQPGGLGPEKDGWSVSKGKSLTFYQSQSAASCRSDCGKNTACVGYTWVKPDGYKAGDPPVCYLMSSIEKLVPHPCCITATKNSTLLKPALQGSNSRKERSEDSLLNEIDKLLQIPEPEIPEGLRRITPSDKKASEARISKRIKELFASSPLVSSEPSSHKITESKQQQKKPIKTRGQKSDGMATNLEGWWKWKADCPTVGIITGHWIITEHDPMGPFKGKFKGIKKYIGDFEGIAGDTGSEYGGIFFNRKEPGPKQKWSGEFTNLDWTLIKGHLKSAVLPDCSFTATKCLDSKCSSLFSNR